LGRIVRPISPTNPSASGAWRGGIASELECIRATLGQRPHPGFSLAHERARDVCFLLFNILLLRLDLLGLVDQAGRPAPQIADIVMHYSLILGGPAEPVGHRGLVFRSRSATRPGIIGRARRVSCEG
jgi:hypothetical protein